MTWYCTADASTASGDPEITKGTHIVNKGPTRDDAYYNAFSDCNSMVTAELSISYPARIVNECRVTSCWSAK